MGYCLFLSILIRALGIWEVFIFYFAAHGVGSKINNESNKDLISIFHKSFLGSLQILTENLCIEFNDHGTEL